MFKLTGTTAVVTGGGGSLGRAMAIGLSQAGASVAITGVSPNRAQQAAEAIQKDNGQAKAYEMNVHDPESVDSCSEQILRDFGQIDILVNCVGGNVKEATTSPELRFFDLPPEALTEVIALNLLGGVILPCQRFGKHMANNADGASIINISSMAAERPLTRVVGYGAAKAAVENFTKWLAVHLATEYSPKLRANAVAPGFFLTEQNRFLLLDEAEHVTERGKTILDHTPMGEFGNPEDLVGAVLWLAGGASRFVSGIVVPVDGGFSAYSGV